MKVFVTGSTGLVGNNLVRLLASQGHEIRALARSEEKAHRLLATTGAKIIKGDMRRIADFAPALEGCDVLFHTAAYFREYYQQGDPGGALEDINIKGTLNLMEEADRRGIKRFIHVSSGGTIGTRPDGSAGDETTPPDPEQLANGYFKSKVDGDEKIRQWRSKNGLQVVEILPGWIWGPGDAAPTQAGQLALDFLARKLPGVLDGGTCIVDARDVAAAMLAAVDKGRGGEKYIIGGEFHTIEEVVHGLARVSGVPVPKLKLPHPVVMAVAFAMEMFGKLTGKPALIQREGVRMMHRKHKLNSDKARKELGISFRPLEETLRDLVAWYRANPIVAAQETPQAKAA